MRTLIWQLYNCYIIQSRWAAYYTVHAKIWDEGVSCIQNTPNDLYINRFTLNRGSQITYKNVINRARCRSIYWKKLSIKYWYVAILSTGTYSDDNWGSLALPHEARYEYSNMIATCIIIRCVSWSDWFLEKNCSQLVISSPKKFSSEIFTWTVPRKYYCNNSW